MIIFVFHHYLAQRFKQKKNKKNRYITNETTTRYAWYY